MPLTGDNYLLWIRPLAADRSSVTDANIHTFQSNNTIIKIIYFSLFVTYFSENKLFGLFYQKILKSIIYQYVYIKLK